MSNLKVIGAGLGRTSTKSLQKALHMLGFGPCHHMSEVLTESNPGVLQNWKKIFLEHDVDLLRSELENYEACVDYPCCMFYKELMELSPQAKVILSVRDSPEQWEKSARSTIMKRSETLPPGDLGDVLAASLELMIRVHGADMHSMETDLKQKYTEWNESVKAHVPADKLLVFNAKEGWEPLCKFLGVPDPNEPFPVSNTTADFNKVIDKALSGQLKQGELDF